MADLHQKILSGARGAVKLEGVEIGHVTDVNGVINFENIVFVECGSPIPKAIVTVGTGVNLSVGYIKIVDEDPVGKSIIPKAADDEIINWPEMELELVDKHTDEVLCTIVGGKPASFNFNFGARTLCGQNVSWQGRYAVWASEE